MWQIRKPKDQDQPEEVAERTEEDRGWSTTGDAGAFATTDPHTDLKVELHQRLLDLINLSALDTMSREQIEDEVGDIVAEELDKQRHALNHAERKQLVDDVLDELLGLGPLEPLLKDPTITDILVNGHDSVFVERYRRARADAGALQGRKAPAAHHPEDRRGGRPPGRRIRRRWSMPASPTAAASTPSCRRWRSTARCSRSANSPRCRSAWTA